MKSVMESVKHAYVVSEIFLWTDSKDCFHWINNSEKIRQKFIQTKIEEIRKNVSSKWRHCPGNLNIADLPSRGVRRRTFRYKYEFMD